MASRHEIVELDMNVDDALKMVISGGVVVPGLKKDQKALESLPDSLQGTVGANPVSPPVSEK